MRFIGSESTRTAARKAVVIGPTGIAWSAVLLLLLFLSVACSRTQLTVPSSTATVPVSPTLGPAAGPDLGGSPTVPSGTAVPQKEVPAVTTDVLNIRAGPGLDYAIKGQLKQGDAITIIGKSADGLWWEYSGGWVSATYVKANGDTSAVPVNTPTP